MNNINLVFSADYRFQVLMVLPNIDNGTAWDIINQLAEKEVLQEEYGIEHYDIVHFNSFKDMNNWIKQQVKDSRL